MVYLVVVRSSGFLSAVRRAHVFPVAYFNVAASHPRVTSEGHHPTVVKHATVGGGGGGTFGPKTVSIDGAAPQDEELPNMPTDAALIVSYVVECSPLCIAKK